MTPKEQSNAEQALTYFAENYPPSLFRFYKNCITEGFSEIQAFTLTQEWWMGIIDPRVRSPYSPPEENK